MRRGRLLTLKPPSASPVAFVRDHTGGQDKNALNASWPTSLSAAVVVGNTLVMSITFDNVAAGGPSVTGISVPTGAGTLSGVAESASWISLGRQAEIAGTGASSIITELWGIVTTQQWLSSFTPTPTIGTARTSKAAVLKEFSNCSLNLRGAAGTNISSSGTPTADVSPLSGDAVVGAIGVESASAPTGDSDTTNGSWSSVLSIGTSGGLDGANVVAALQHKIVTADGTQTFNPTGVSNDTGIVVVALQPAA